MLNYIAMLVPLLWDFFISFDSFLTKRWNLQGMKRANFISQVSLSFFFLALLTILLPFIVCQWDRTGNWDLQELREILCRFTKTWSHFASACSFFVVVVVCLFLQSLLLFLGFEMLACSLCLNPVTLPYLTHGFSKSVWFYFNFSESLINTPVYKKIDFWQLFHSTGIKGLI